METRPQSTCEQCGAPFERTGNRGRPPRFCPECRTARRQPGSASTVRCGRCKREKPAEEFAPSARKPGAWCRECFRHAYREAAGGMVTKACETCGAQFTTTARGAKRKRFCSVKCKNSAKDSARRATLAEAKTNRTCEHCGGPIGLERRSDTRTCSELCATKLRRTPEKEARYRLTARLKKYGLAPEQYERLLVHGCGVCGLKDERQLHIDHCHSEGHVRGLLCGTCNTGLGQFRDNPTLLRAAAEYIERTRDASY